MRKPIYSCFTFCSFPAFEKIEESKAVSPHIMFHTFSLASCIALKIIVRLLKLILGIQYSVVAFSPI